MRELFAPDGPLYGWALKVYQIVVLQFLFFLAALPLATIGASATALYATWFSIWEAKDDGKLARSFFHEFKRNFRRSSALWIAMVACGVACTWLIYPVVLAPAIHAFPPLLFAAALAVAVLALTSGYLFPLAARFENATWRTAWNSFLIAMSNMGPSVLIFAIHAAAAIAWLLPTGRFGILGIACSFGFASFCNSWILIRVFRKYIPACESPDAGARSSRSRCCRSRRPSSPPASPEPSPRPPLTWLRWFSSASSRLSTSPGPRSWSGRGRAAMKGPGAAQRADDRLFR